MNKNVFLCLTYEFNLENFNEEFSYFVTLWKRGIESQLNK